MEVINKEKLEIRGLRKDMSNQIKAEIEYQNVDKAKKRAVEQSKDFCFFY